MLNCVFNGLGIVVALALPATAENCDFDIAAMEARIAALEQDYGQVLSDISCDAPELAAHQLMCNSAENSPDTLWQMGRLDTMAWVYAAENATGSKVDLGNPPLDAGFIAARDACTGVDCICAVLIAHTNDSLGGTSPYPQD